MNRRFVNLFNKSIDKHLIVDFINNDPMVSIHNSLMSNAQTFIDTMVAQLSYLTNTDEETFVNIRDFINRLDNYIKYLKSMMEIKLNIVYVVTYKDDKIMADEFKRVTANYRNDINDAYIRVSGNSLFR